MKTALRLLTLALAFLQLYVIYGVQPQPCQVSPSVSIGEIWHRDPPHLPDNCWCNTGKAGRCYCINGDPEKLVQPQSYTWIETTGEFQSLPFPCPAEKRCI